MEEHKKVERTFISNTKCRSVDLNNNLSVPSKIRNKRGKTRKHTPSSVRDVHTVCLARIVRHYFMTLVIFIGDETSKNIAARGNLAHKSLF